MEATVSRDTIISYQPEQESSITVHFYKKIPVSISSPILSTKKKVLLVVDQNLDINKQKITERLLKKLCNNVVSFILPYKTKNLAQVEKIWHAMVGACPDVVVALGGGTICDMVGFAASCYHRGLDHVFFPTTLLSMVDACIGGMTGFDFDGIKNSVGQVHYAKESYCIFPFLETLEYDELKSGISEIIKIAILFDEKLFDDLEKLPGHFDTSHGWFAAITRSAQLKARISEQSFSERSKLMYGHNIGHGVETYSSSHRRHGDCVSIGINYELALACVGGMVDKKVWKRQYALLKKFGLIHSIPKGINILLLKEKMKLYKLYRNGSFLFVIPKTVGSALQSNGEYYWQVPEKDFEALLYQATKTFNMSL